MAIRVCKTANCKDDSGNCSVTGSDGLPVQCVGPWVEDKYFFLEHYLDATWGVRKQFSGNTVFVDLFAGSGRCIVEETKKEIDSGGIRALNRDKAPFDEYFFFDIDKTNAEALKKRLGSKPNCYVRCGDSNVLVTALMEELLKKPYRYHFIFVDPFGPNGLKFNTLKILASLQRPDMFIHFPMGAIKRNLPNWMKKKDTILDEFLGTTVWREKIKGQPQKQIFKILLDIFKEQLKSIGYPEEGLRMVSWNKDIYGELPVVSIKNTREVDLYVLILAAKHPLAQKIWSTIVKMSPNGQKTLF